MRERVRMVVGREDCRQEHLRQNDSAVHSNDYRSRSSLYPFRTAGCFRSGPTYQLEDDRFFSEKLIGPGERLVLRDTSPGTPDQACCIDPLAGTHEPSAEYRLEFAQFADGSVFGDPAEAQGSLAIRRTIMRGLHELIESYEQGGESGFIRALGNLRSAPTDSDRPPRQGEQPPFFTTAICRQILASYDSAGAGAALEETRKTLKVAETHDALIAQ